MHTTVQEQKWIVEKIIEPVHLKEQCKGTNH